LVAFAVVTKDDAHVYVLDGKSDDPMMLPSDTRTPSFSRDGGELYFAGAFKGKNEEFYQIKRLNLFTRNIETISNGTANDDFPAPSPDGLQVAFISSPVGDSESPEGVHWRLWLMDREGKNRRLLDPNGPKTQIEPSWSPDSSKIVYVTQQSLDQLFPADIKERLQKGEKIPREELEKYIKQFRSPLMVFDFATGASKELTPPDVTASYPSWSPKGDLIAFTRQGTQNETSIWGIKPDGADLRPLTSGTSDSHPSINPDGQSLIFTREQDGKRVIWELNLQTLQERKFLEDVKGVQGIVAFERPRLGKFTPPAGKD
jgi:Tol biopolymer transport system component